MTLEEISEWLNAKYPTRNWNQWCQQLMWNCVYAVMGYTRDSQMGTYPRADLARDASHIESTDPTKAPAGAMHWFTYPIPDGHVGMSLGGSRVLMTGTEEALGVGGVLLGKNYGVTTVEAYVKAKGNRYLGWSKTNGANPTLIGKIGEQSKEGAFEMPALIRTPDGSIGFVSDAGMLDAISGMPEVEALQASGLVGGWVNQPDGLVWQLLAARTARLRAQQAQVDPSKLAAEIASLMVGPVVEALSKAGNLSKADVEDAVKRVTQELLAKAAA